MERTSWTSVGHLAVLSGIAIGQPLYDLLARNPEFFVAHHSTAIEIWLFILLVSIVPAVVLGSIELLTEQFSIPLRRSLNALSVVVFTALIGLYFLRTFEQMSGHVSIAIAVVLGILVSTLYWRFVAMRLFCTIMLPSILIFPAIFVLFSPVNELLFSKPTTSIEPVISESKVPVVVLVFDELPVTSLMDKSRNIDSQLYPSFAALAKDATWYRNATAVAPDTLIAVPAILSGMYPDDFRLPTLTNYPNNLFTLFSNSHEINVHEQYTMMSPSTINQTIQNNDLESKMGRLISDLWIVYLHEIVPSDLAANLPSITEGWTEFGKELNSQNEASPLISEKQMLKSFKGEVKNWNRNRDQLFLEWVDSIVPTSKPIFTFFHSVLPHVPWQYLPSGKRYALDGNNPITGLTKARWNKFPFFSTQAYQRHLLQLGYVDKLLGKLMEQLKSTGLYDQSLLIITADHGVSFIPGLPRRVPTSENYYDIMPIPMFIKLPGQSAGAVNDVNIETVDILPTVIDILGVKTNWSLDGRSAASLASEPRKNKTIYSSRGRNKLLFEESSLNRKYETLERKLSIFGSGTYKIGPYPEIIGRNIRDFRITNEVEFDILLDEPGLFENVSPKSGFVPAYISGFIRGNSKQIPEYVAVALNDTVQAVTRPWGSGTYQWISIVDELGFVSGKNDIKVFGVVETEDELILQGASMRTIETFSSLINEDYKTIFSLNSADPKSFRFNKKIRAGETENLMRKPLIFEAIAKGPYFLLPEVKYPERGITVAVDITVPADSKFSVFFRTTSQPIYTREQQVSQLTKKGRNMLLLTVRSEELTGRLRIDPGASVGNYIVNDLVVHAFEEDRQD